MFNPLVHSTGLSYPHRIVSSAWIEHVPFGMTIVELMQPRLLVELGVYLGVSYCGFCQAIDQLGLETRAFGIDTWEGDAHSGYNDPAILDELRAYHDPLYGRFSSLLKSKFHDALDCFDEGSIDLLHIDGYHTYEAVREDYSSWLPKMSSRGVMMFHDIRARLPGFGVWRLWEEIEARHPTFAFDHQYGLGIAAVGSEIPEGLAGLFAAPAEERSKIRLYFSQLGQRLSARLLTDSHDARLRELEALLKSQAPDQALCLD